MPGELARMASKWRIDGVFWTCVLKIVYFKLYVYFVYIKLYVYFEWSPPVSLKNDALATP